MRARMLALSLQAKDEAGKALAHHVEVHVLSLKTTRQLSIALFKNLSDEIVTDYLDNLLMRFHARRYLLCFGSDTRPVFARVDDNKPLDKSDAIFAACAQRPLIPPTELDIIFVPGLAFTKQGHRLGRGKGYYDQALAPIKSALKRPYFIGVAMDEQIVTEIPLEMHDVAMDYLCTPALGMFSCLSE